MEKPMTMNSMARIPDHMDHYAEQLAILPEFLHFRTNKLRQCCFPNKSGAMPAFFPL